MNENIGLSFFGFARYAYLAGKVYNRRKKRSRESEINYQHGITYSTKTTTN